MIDNVLRPAATLLVVTGVVALIGAPIVRAESAFWLLLWIALFTLPPGWLIFVLTRDR